MSFRLTHQRLKILKLLSGYGCLRTQHFYGLLGAGTASAQRAVRRLLCDFSRSGFLTCRPLMDYSHFGPFPRYENIYWISPSGTTVAEVQGCSATACEETLPELIRRRGRRAQCRGRKVERRSELFIRQQKILLQCRTMPKSDNTSTIQTVAHIVMAGAALFALFRDDRTLGLALSVVALAAIVPKASIHGFKVDRHFWKPEIL